MPLHHALKLEPLWCRRLSLVTVDVNALEMDELLGRTQLETRMSPLKSTKKQTALPKWNFGEQPWFTKALQRRVDIIEYAKTDPNRAITREGTCV